jgi:hypothetical protein
LRYLATATDKLNERDIGQALNEVLPVLEEKFMPTLTEKWLEQGRQEARAEMTTLAEKWLEQGRQEGLAKGHTKGHTEGIQAGERRVLLRPVGTAVRFLAGSVPGAHGDCRSGYLVGMERTGVIGPPVGGDFCAVTLAKNPVDSSLPSACCSLPYGYKS